MYPVNKPLDYRVEGRVGEVQKRYFLSFPNNAIPVLIERQLSQFLDPSFFLERKQIT